MEYLTQFDQLGEYKYSDAQEEQEESKHEAVQMVDQIKAKYEEEIYDIVQSKMEINNQDPNRLLARSVDDLG